MTDNTEKNQLKRQQKYWQKNLKLILILLSIWFLVSYVGGIILAKPLSNIPFFGVSLSFWLANQGSILIFVILIFIYAFYMDRLDEEYVKENKANNKKEKGGFNDER